jgi:hypothetical protein
MKHSALSRALVVITATALTHLPVTASACSACMGDVNSKIAPAMNAAIFLMLGFIGFMLLSAASFAFYLMKRANVPVSPHAEFGSTINPQENPS